MASATITQEFDPNYYAVVSGTNIDAGNNDVELEYNLINTHSGFSVKAGTLTAVDVTVLCDGVDMTSKLFGVATLASDCVYICDLPLPVKTVTVRSAQTNATNEVNVEIFAPKRR